MTRPQRFRIICVSFVCLLSGCTIYQSDGKKKMESNDIAQIMRTQIESRPCSYIRIPDSARLMDQSHSVSVFGIASDESPTQLFITNRTDETPVKSVCQLSYDSVEWNDHQNEILEEALLFFDHQFGAEQ